MPLKIITTEDGSQSLFDEELNETYHSTKGARSESEYVFIEQGLNQLSNLKEQLTILEVGFGTGLNAWLTWRWAEERKTSLHFCSLEPFPISDEIIEKMDLRSEAKFRELHDSKWNEEVNLSEHFKLEKRIKKLEDENSAYAFDIVFFDAFAPSKQPDVWSLENLYRCYNALKKGGILTTYCAQGQFKRNMKEVGFELDILPGALGKAQMVRGRKPN